MSSVTEEQVLNALRNVMDPDLNKDIVSLDFIKDLKIDGPNVSFRLVLTTPACPVKDKLKAEAEERVRTIDGVENVEVTLDAKTLASREPGDALPNIKHVLLVASGKGGVGKSTVAVNIAAALRKTGAAVGIMDADIYGPSIPWMLGVTGPPRVEDNKMIPPVAHDMQIISIGFLAREEDALIWRGPILHKVLTQFVQDVKWGDLDYLVIDLPPGTGDVQISLTQLVHASAALLVSTPQDIAFRDVRRAAVMFNKVNVPIIGLVENMAYFVCPHCGTKTEIFPRATDETLRHIADGMFVETLASIPLEPAVAKSSELGVPVVISNPDSETAKAFNVLAGKIAQKLSIIAVGIGNTVPIKQGSTDQD